MTSDWILVSALLRERLVLYLLGGLGVLYLVLSLFEFSIWQCPWRELTGRRCLGCGLTTGCKAILRGQFWEGVAWNWLSPFVLLGLLVMGVILAVPPALRSRILAVIESWERKYRFVLIGVLLLTVQAIVRVLGRG